MGNGPSMWHCLRKAKMLADFFNNIQETEILVIGVTNADL